MKFQKGKSGNPSGLPGRPRTRDIAAAIREFSSETLKNGKSRLRQMLEVAERRARQGNPRHLEILLSYGWGKPLQQNINLNAELTREQELAAMSDEERTALLHKLLDDAKARGVVH